MRGCVNSQVAEKGGAMWPNLDALDSAGDKKAAEPGEDEEGEEDLGSSEEDEALDPEQESRLVLIFLLLRLSRECLLVHLLLLACYSTLLAFFELMSCRC